MRAFNIGFISTLSLLIIVSVIFLTFGYYPTPQGPKYPTYPVSAAPQYDQNGFATSNTQEQNQAYDKYNEDIKKYDDESKNFMKDKLIPYVQNILVGWVVILIVFQVLAILLTKSISPLIGGAFAITGIWAVLVGPFLSIILMTIFGISGITGSEDTGPLAQSMYRMVGITSTLGSVLLAVLGLKLIAPAKDSK